MARSAPPFPDPLLVHAFIKFMCDDRLYSWNFNNLTQVSLGTIEFRRAPMSTCATDAITWLVFAITRQRHHERSGGDMGAAGGGFRRCWSSRSS